MKNFAFFLLLALLSFQAIGLTVEKKSSAVLQASLHIVPSSAIEIKTAKIQPGSEVSLQVEVKNIGSKPSAPGTLYVRFVLMEPMEDLLESRLFKTEVLPVPKIYPGQVVVLKFATTHQWPSIIDYIKQNWNMRHYQAIFKQKNDKNECVLGNLPIFISAYYYEGLRQDSPKEVLSLD